MADVRCPMCSNLNPESAEICGTCSARLQPLIVDSSSPESPPAGSDESRPSEEATGEEVPDWLERIRVETVSDAPEEKVTPEETTDDAESDDWLGRLRESDTREEEGPPEGEVPDWVQEISGEEEAAEAEPEGFERLREIAAQAAVGAEVGSEPADDDWLGRLREEDQALPVDVVEGELQPEVEFSEDTLVDEPLVPAIPSPTAAVKPDVEPEFVEPTDVRATPTEVPAPDVPPSEEVPSEDISAIEGTPFWLEDITEDRDPALPHVPALVLDESEKSAIDETSDIDLDSIKLPDWLSDLGETTLQEELVAEKVSPDLAPATLPSWLEAMRPIETFRSVVEIEPEDDQTVESAGPLAGLHGVLMAEPVVAMPRAATIGTTGLEVTERQFAQAEILQRMVEEEEIERPDAVVGRARMPVLRWVIGLLLVLAVTIPVLLPVEAGLSFPLPSLVPRDLGQIIDLVENVAVEQPVLVVFDYTPGYVGELGAVAEPLLQHIVSRGLRTVSISTQPTGPPLAENLLNRFGENGEDYIHLGYLAGGPTAVQLFAAAPLDTFAPGFLLPEDLTADSVWDSPILKGIKHLSDFSLIVVITSGTEGARSWAEQASPWVGETPLIMAISAGAAPIVRPYYEALESSVDGILTGLPAAVGYAKLMGHEGDAHSRWDAYGMGLHIVELILLAGVIYGIALWLLRLQAVGTRGTSDG